HPRRGQERARAVPARVPACGETLRAGGARARTAQQGSDSGLEGQCSALAHPWTDCPLGPGLQHRAPSRRWFRRGLRPATTVADVPQIALVGTGCGRPYARGAGWSTVLGRRLTAGRQTLDLTIKVRILAPQPRSPR